jgi:hypothetical protein
MAVRYLLRQDALERGHQSRLAEHFNMSRQRVHQVVNEEQQRRERIARVRQARAAAATVDAASAPPRLTDGATDSG